MNHRLNAGALRHVMYLQQPTVVRGNVDGWRNVVNPTIRCQIEQQSATETDGRSGERHEVTLKVTTRYRSDITAEKRLCDVDGNAFDIVSIEDVEMRKQTMILQIVNRHA